MIHNGVQYSFNNFIILFTAGVLTLLINGKYAYLDAFSPAVVVNDTEIEWKNIGGSKSLSVSYVSGAAIEISVLNGLLSVSLTAPQSFTGKTRGLLGVYNGDTEDDFTKPDGTMLPENSSEAEIYENFGQLCKSLFKPIFFIGC